MIAETVLAGAYACSGFVACALYLPQLRTLATSAEARRSMSLTTWGGWLVVGLVGLAYAGLVLKDGPMVVVTGVNSALQAVVVIVVLRQRVWDRRVPPPAGAAPGRAGRSPKTARAG